MGRTARKAQLIDIAILSLKSQIAKKEMVFPALGDNL